jgi:DeoR/GlpR family transcriptional regulator of sugar metabolism
VTGRSATGEARHGGAGASSTPAAEPVTVSVLERREQIASLVEDVPRVSVAELAAQFGVTDVSIRRDLTILEEQGFLRRVHGGAVAATREHGRNAYALRARTAREEKKRIGAAAAALVSPGDVVAFDSGSTVAQVAAHIARPLRRSNALTVVTNSLPVLDEVGRWESPHLVCLGGLYLPDHQALVGPQTAADMRGLSADIAFLGCEAHRETGLTTPHRRDRRRRLAGPARGGRGDSRMAGRFASSRSEVHARDGPGGRSHQARAREMGSRWFSHSAPGTADGWPAREECSSDDRKARGPRRDRHGDGPGDRHGDRPDVRR